MNVYMKYRTRAGLTQALAAAQFGTSARHWSSLERGIGADSPRNRAIEALVTKAEISAPRVELPVGRHALRGDGLFVGVRA